MSKSKTTQKISSKEIEFNAGWRERFASVLKHGAQGELAIALGIDKGTVSNWKKGSRADSKGMPSLFQMSQVAKSLNVSAGWLGFDEGDIPSERDATKSQMKWLYSMKDKIEEVDNALNSLETFLEPNELSNQAEGILFEAHNNIRECCVEIMNMAINNQKVLHGINLAEKALIPTHPDKAAQQNSEHALGSPARESSPPYAPSGKPAKQIPDAQIDHDVVAHQAWMKEQKKKALGQSQQRTAKEDAVPFLGPSRKKVKKTRKKKKKKT